MRLVIGGYAQGKLTYVLQKYQIDKNMVYDAALPQEGKDVSGKVCQPMLVINHFHRWVWDRIRGGGCPEEEINIFLARCRECIIISDEIGNGIVPLEPKEREYRERLGRILVRLAGEAEGVERVICGIGQKIK